ncbi:MAG: acetyltransferase [Pseudomonadota bacterium]
MSQPNLILLGAGGHARACIDVIEQQGLYRLAGLIAPPSEVGTLHCGHRVIASDNELAALSQRYPYAFIGIGQLRSPTIRIRMFHQLLDLGFQLPTLIAPDAYVSPHASIGSGSIIMHGAIINAGAKVGRNCIINSRALVEHDAQIDDHCHLSTGAILNGGVRLGEGSFVGSASVVKEGVTLPPGSLLGMGSMIKNAQQA